MNTSTAVDLDLRRAGAADRAKLASTVAAAFFDDPVTCWLLPDLDARRRLIEPMFSIYIDPYLRNGETYLNGSDSGAAVWLTPGDELFEPGDEDIFGEQLAELVGSAIDRFLQLGELFAEHHPAEPHYYCQFLATLPTHQGKGIGSAFLRDILSRADAKGAPAYHEATSLRNRALYERHGYVNQGEIVLPEHCPTLWRMWRDPS